MVVDYPIFHTQPLLIAVDHENKAKPAIMRRSTKNHPKWTITNMVVYQN